MLERSSSTGIAQEINARGVAVDMAALEECRVVVAGISERLTIELSYLTHGRITSVDQIAQIQGMLAQYGIDRPDMTADTVKGALSDTKHPVHGHPWARRVLEIRRDLASAGVKKLEAIHHQVCSDGRLRGLFAYSGAERTARWAGRGPQPHNLPRGNASLAKCTECGHLQGGHVVQCTKCWGPVEPAKWSFTAALAAIKSFRDRDVDAAVSRWGDVLAVVAGCLRALFVAAPGMEFYCSDYRAIEAVVLAALAGEEWRLEVFRTHGKIYELSASKITGIPFAEYAAYKERTGEHHPTRNSVGKIAELASGFAGGMGAWKNFGADKHMTDDEIRAAINRWRDESPNIVRMWKGVERAAMAAIKHPGTSFPYREVTYTYDGRVLRCVLPSGRPLVYHQPTVEPGPVPWGGVRDRIKFWGYNSNPKYGAIGWRQLDTYGGRLTENIVQAVARDLLAHGMRNAARADYRIVLHIHDEIVCEQPIGQGSIAELERLMGDMPPWARGWPVEAMGGWVGRCYRKG
jgi:DNA polymerase